GREPDGRASGHERPARAAPRPQGGERDADQRGEEREEEIVIAGPRGGEGDRQPPGGDDGRSSRRDRAAGRNQEDAEPEQPAASLGIRGNASADEDGRDRRRRPDGGSVGVAGIEAQRPEHQRRGGESQQGGTERQDGRRRPQDRTRREE